MEGVIQNSPYGNDPLGVSEDPLEKAIAGFGIEQRRESFTEKGIMALVREKINNIKIDLENPAATIEEVVKYLEEEDIEVSKDMRKYIEMIGVGTIANFFRDKERAENKDSVKMALADAKWMGAIIEYIRENRDNPKKIEELWQQYDTSFLNLKKQSNEDFPDKYNRRRGPKVTKRGILTEIAAMDLLEEMANSFEGCEKVEIEYSTPKEDVHQKIDFFLIVTLENGKLVKIPVQVTSCDLSKPIDNPLDEREKTWLDIKKEREGLDRKIEFVLGNTIHTSETVKDIEINPDYKYQEGIEDKMKKFFDENGDGIFVFVPYGKIKDKKFDSIRGEDTRKKCVRENGEPSRALKDHFNRNSTIESIEASLTQIAQ